MSIKHVSVLLSEVTQALTFAHDGFGDATKWALYDGTLGGGGHTSALLRVDPRVFVTGGDWDEQALERVRQGKDAHGLSEFLDLGRLQLHHGSFESPPIGPFDGVIVDLGYSSIQLQDRNYGMSFQEDGPIDMRLTRPPKGLSAWELIHKASESELTRLFQAYGESPLSGRVARRIKQSLHEGSLEDSTRQLADLIYQSTPQARKLHHHPATTFFQALRIAVNDELRVLDRFLNGIHLHLNPKGRIAVITFHSLEDRLVKQWSQKTPHFVPVVKKPILPSEAEIAENPRSRSAKLRLYERV